MKSIITALILICPILSICELAHGENSNVNDFDKCVKQQINSTQNYGVPNKQIRDYCECALWVIKKDSQSDNLSSSNLKMKIINECVQKKGENEINVEKELHLLSKEQNKTLPKNIDKYTILTTTSAGPGKKFHIFYRLISHKKSDIDVSSMKKNLKPEFVNIFCSEPTYEYLRFNSVDLIYQLNDVNGNFVTKIYVNKNDCK